MIDAKCGRDIPIINANYCIEPIKGLQNRLNSIKAKDITKTKIDAKSNRYIKPNYKK